MSAVKVILVTVLAGGVSIGAALGFVLLWPFRRMIRNRRAAQAPKAESKRAGPPPAP